MLASLLCFLVVLIFFLFWLEFDVLASLLFGVYSSVFIVFFLLLLHFTTFWAPATKTSRSKNYSLFFFSLIAFITFTLFMYNYTSSTFFANWSFNYLWQDFSLLSQVPTSMLVHILHFFFFRFFIFETLVLNLYLLFSLVLALILLSLFKVYVSMGFFSTKKSNLGSLSRLTTDAHFTSSHSDRTRQVSKFRRQTRRQNSSILRHK